MHRLLAIVSALFMVSAALPLPAAPIAQAEKLGLVLSGGGARGFAHIGALKALEELGIRPDILTATSMGAMVGGGYAAGYSPEDLRRITMGIDWVKMFSPLPDRNEKPWRRRLDNAKGLSNWEVPISLSGVESPVNMVPTQELDTFLMRVTEPVNTVNDLTRLNIPFTSMATDLVTGNAVAMQKDVPLATAMRSSMSIPGVFAPVEFKDYLLCDGGVVDNLPVGQARRMGADRVIAINVGTPLSGRESLGSLVGILGQMINILTEQNVQESIASLKEGDILITPELSAYTSGDFTKAEEIMKIGYDAVMARREELLDYVRPSGFREWAEARRNLLSARGERMIAEIRIEGLSRVNEKKVIEELDLDTSKPVSNDDVARAARYVWATGDFSNVRYHFEPARTDAEILVFNPIEKLTGYSTLRIGGKLESNFDDINNYSVTLAHTLGWVNLWGAEMRTEVDFGDHRRVYWEWNQPLGPASAWFVRPQFLYQQDPYDIYVGKSNTPVARNRNQKYETGLYFGRELGRWGEAYAGLGWQHISTEHEIGNWEYGASSSAGFLSLGIAVDTLDNLSFPREGFRLSLKATYYHNRSGSSGSYDPYNETYEVSGSLPLPLTRQWTALVSGHAARTSQQNFYSLGGAFNLSGSPYGRFSGDRVALGRVMVYRDLSDHFSLLGMPMYVGATYEIGTAKDKAGGSTSTIGWTSAAGAFIGIDTWIGPVYLVAGRTFGWGDAVTLYWGRLQF